MLAFIGSTLLGILELVLQNNFRGALDEPLEAMGLGNNGMMR
jgi:hypothetical protein